MGPARSLEAPWIAGLLLVMVPALAGLEASALAQSRPDAEVPATEAPAPTPMARIPAGEFTLGTPGSTELPAHRVRVSAFEIDIHEVTNAQYRAFCLATNRKLPVFWELERFQCGIAWPDHPVIGVSQGDAQAYAEWVGKRLPTEAEWVLAARAGGNGRYGGDLESINPELANYNKTDRDAPAPVMSYPANAYGVFDLIGNVREWTSDRFGVQVPTESLVPEDGDLTGVVPCVDPTGPAKGRLGVIKGGGWYSGSSCQAVAVRNGYPRGWGDFAVGFRCARDVE